MFDLSFGHLVVLFLVALTVLGPERLPVVARAMGRWVGKARTYMRNFSAELERETQITDLKKQLQDAQRILDEQSRQVQNTLNRLPDAVSTGAAAPAPPAAALPAAPSAPVEAAPAPSPTNSHGG